MHCPGINSPMDAISLWENRPEDDLMTTEERESECLVTKRPLSAIWIGGGANLRGPVRQIPSGVQIRVCGHTPDPRLVEVRWGKRHLAVFAVDLEDGAGQRRDQVLK